MEINANMDVIRKSLALLGKDGELFEFRALSKTERVKTYSGYFTSVDVLIDELNRKQSILKNYQWYFTLNELNSAVYARAQRDTIMAADRTTSDKEVNSYKWIFIDFDPVRMADISSSNEELDSAVMAGKEVHDYLQSCGFSEPVPAFSGNGFHLLYKVDFPVNDENISLVKDLITMLHEKYSSDAVDVDKTTFNPARICKLYGSIAKKGSNTEERPHRLSSVCWSDSDVKPELTPIEIIQRVVENYRTEKKESEDLRPQAIRENTQFDLYEFLQKNGITYREQDGDRSKILRLDHCPFDHSHTNGDAKIFVYADGAHAFKCHHNSCSGKKWQDVRKLFEPEYDPEGFKNRIEKANESYKEKTKVITPGKKLKSAQNLITSEITDPIVYIGVGDNEPLLVEGTCILSAKPKMGKSWFVMSMCLAVCKGENFLGRKTRQCACLYLDLETSESIQKKRIQKLLNGERCPDNFYIESFSPDDETGFPRLEDGCIEQLESYMEQDSNIGIIIIDVFTLVQSEKKRTESDAKWFYRDVAPLNRFAAKHHVSLILVWHNRKQVTEDSPFDDISGSNGFFGAVHQAIVMSQPKKDSSIRRLDIIGKTIDGRPRVDVDFAEGKMVVVGNQEDYEAEKIEYMASPIRNAIIELVKQSGKWVGRCGELIRDAMTCGITLNETPKEIGYFLVKNQRLFAMMDNITIERRENGSGGKLYKATKNILAGEQWKQAQIEDVPFQDK